MQNIGKLIVIEVGTLRKNWPNIASQIAAEQSAGKYPVISPLDANCINAQTAIKTLASIDRLLNPGRIVKANDAYYVAPHMLHHMGLRNISPR
ncbi:MAG TPA: hypothetical protein PLK94_11480 [Alphaproteobacteria bacterium]|nr:hypothetical protein [Alphaproteobacteria bacterium]HOO51898.1 hypothetical protein [Alphaproteobacteria bacterium]